MTVLTMSVVALSNGVLSAAPNTTANPDVTWTANRTFYISSNDSATPQAGFLISNTTSSSVAITDGWRFFGQQIA